MLHMVCWAFRLNNQKRTLARFVHTKTKQVEANFNVSHMQTFSSIQGKKEKKKDILDNDTFLVRGKYRRIMSFIN